VYAVHTSVINIDMISSSLLLYSSHDIRAPWF